ncbi:hypothetical protein K504DRAFT_492574 [Pleomassaria siparia CBS 279.74]|uniref:Uncharacterized protein n=1 Tax=Pleomassaria siparia CBS 279.74 TaxID=1314801 RepID=A0A6G1K3B4_9PLEO|nr:hypothetical protein K504DRAFT_492574 [Pleomassaria siparia CBS 279.74]
MGPHKATVKGSSSGAAAKKKAKSKVKKKTNFFDLRDGAVKACWENILGHVLILKKPILVDESHWRYDRKPLPHETPSAAKEWTPGMSELGSKVYFSENTFYFNSNSTFDRWTAVNRTSGKLLRKVGVDITSALTSLVDGIQRCSGLQELRIGVNEVQFVETMCQPEHGFRHDRKRPKDITPQLNLLVLRTNGMDKLRETHVPKVKFTPLVHGSITDITIAKRTTGPIRHGTLEKVVAKEMMIPKEVVTSTYETNAVIPIPKRKPAVDSDDEYNPGKRSAKRARVGTRSTPARAAKSRISAIGALAIAAELDPQAESEPEPDVEAVQEATEKASTLATTPQAFQILNLPAELRNQIYRHILVIDGPVNPSKRIPTTHHRAGTNLPEKALYRSGTAPSSCLALLQTNKQVSKEASVFFYQNAFVFYYPNQMMMFLQTISEDRKQYIEQITLWYHNLRQGDTDSIDVYLSAVGSLKKLRIFELMLDDGAMYHLERYRRAGTSFAGESSLKEMVKGGLDVRVRSQNVDTYFWKRKRNPAHDASSLMRFRASRGAIRNLQSRIRSISTTDEVESSRESSDSSEQ